MSYELSVTSGTDKWIIPYQTISLTDELNQGVYGEVSINYLAIAKYAAKFGITPDDIFASDYAEWQLYKDTSLLYAGVFAHRKISGSKAQPTAYSISLVGFEYLLKSRYTGNAGVWKYTNTDSADIAWGMINQSQVQTNGNMGITRGLHPVTINRDKTNRYDQLLDAIISMSNNAKYNGYDWEITPQKVFNIYYPNKGQTLSNLVLDDFNIISWTNDRDITVNLANKVIVLGAGYEDSIITETVENATSQASWGLQETTLSEKDTTVSANLTAKGNLLLGNKATPKDIVSVRISDRSPNILSYNVGDTLPVKISDIGFSKNLRIDKRTLQIETSGEATVDLSFQYAA